MSRMPLAPALIAAGICVAVLSGCRTVPDAPDTLIRSAIINAICYDVEVAEVSRDSLYASGDPEDALLLYAEMLAQVPLTDTPSAFAEAYLAHARAWKINDEPEIESSWERITQTAAMHGVDVEEIQAAGD